MFFQVNLPKFPIGKKRVVAQKLLAGSVYTGCPSFRPTRPIGRPSDRPSIQSRVRPTDSLSSVAETQNKYCPECHDTYFTHSHYKEKHKSCGAVEGRTTFVVAMNRVRVVALNIMLVLRFSKIGRSVHPTGSRLDGRSLGRTSDRSSKTELWAARVDAPSWICLAG